MRKMNERCSLKVTRFAKILASVESVENGKVESNKTLHVAVAQSRRRGGESFQLRVESPLFGDMPTGVCAPFWLALNTRPENFYFILGAAGVTAFRIQIWIDWAGDSRSVGAHAGDFGCSISTTRSSRKTMRMFSSE